ncbi:uncharacterized protein E0L32_012288 [Thyridium curvatum]|uniref:Dolichyl-diphosphooligosaccharide--protein glycosyltransferase subunit 4 n=1 Tax=Thyridium curvatum TaxID=1093900 RepID=A0A507BE79_9PEZI|nr:uncharacterized protein E0L32_012288 [Thyridium curvatum]TPX17054.1 hypothetical protein E0L32_012288 [Thyridium curvatum]
MISDDDLYRLAIFLGSAAMVLIVIYHFFEINAREEDGAKETSGTKARAATGKQASSTR